MALGQSSFVNFETAPVHPISISPDRRLMAVCNLPDARVELFDLTQTPPRQIGSVPTGVDPVTARFRPNGELWVVNCISDSISIIDPARMAVVATLDTFDAPGDVVFTHGGGRAFVSQSGANVVSIWDTATRTQIGSVDIEGDRPKAMAVSADGSEIYIAILESGNASTILAPAITGLARSPQPSVVDLPDGPHGGLNPAPNAGEVFSPAINPEIPAGSLPPRTSLIVRKQNGRWLDDNGGDWTAYITGDKAHLTGRIQGWDVADHDLAIMKTADGSVRYARGLMNICFDVAVNPADGKVAVIGTDAINEVRFEPVLKSIFTRVKVAMVNPADLSSKTADLNPHLDYVKRSIPLTERRQSAGDPRAIAWNSRGDRAYIAAMGSNNLLMIDRNGDRIGSAVTLPDGPSALALDELRNRVYVYCRFAAKIVCLDLQTLATIHTLPLHDPTPDAVRLGRKHFYDTVANSGLGHTACASCHIDGRFDRLAWDLGDPAGDILDLLTRQFTFTPTVTNKFHPMKGPMVTQTLVDIIGHEPFHWRGDRDGIEAFNVTFPDLQGRDEELTAEQMAEFKAFLASMTFPPNPNRFKNNVMPEGIVLFSERTLGRGNLPPGQLFPPGNALRGLGNFLNTLGAACSTCHTLPTGLGPDAQFRSGRWQPIPLGPNQEHHIGMVAQERTGVLPFKIQHLRNLHEKFGFDLRSTKSRSGFGFFHDGRVDTLTHFIQDGFPVVDDQETADLIALLMAFTGSDLPDGIPTNVDRPPGVTGRDVPSGVGMQTMMFTPDQDDRTTFMFAHGARADSRIDLVAYGTKDGKARAWFWRAGAFQSDRTSETISAAGLRALATAQTPLTLMFVPRGSGQRIAIDQDGDGFFNLDEIDVGSEPANANITPATTTARLSFFGVRDGRIVIEWSGKIADGYRVQACEAISAAPVWNNVSERIVIAANPVSHSEPFAAGVNARFYRVHYEP